MSSERQLDNTNTPWWGEHLHRYEEAVRLFSGKKLKVLDIACGSGFGSNFLVQAGNTVFGGDLSEETISDCKNKFKHSQLSFEQMDGTALPYPDIFFDAVISFETIEHTTDYQKMLNEFKRVVKKEGLVILSTPNFLVNSPHGVIINPYHTQEWKYEEVLAILNNTFSDVKLLGQKYSRYSNKPQVKYKIGRIIERLLYTKGIRKLPIVFQDRIMKMIIGEPMYPLSCDYSFTEDINEIKACKTFFAICKP
ncbi:MAG: class SAM-dependent methyltransferase [Bacteroidota bacterium]|jgi:ubiquinone/menaquinone biosynthesis C-methylase UbiE|nr:class SAM-dependent methyltransferase [Bacteroidota bacterium]